MDILQSLRRFINKHDLLERGSIVIIGVSGGPDSLCLLHALNILAPEYDIRLHVAHLNHQLRGDEAKADADFVRSIAEQWKLPYTLESRDVAAFAKQHKLSTEEAARQVRYGFLIEVASKQASRTLAVAHNADDQTESVLMHFLRGSGMSGLRGMLPKISMEEYRIQRPEEITQHAARSTYLIRPLLEVPRDLIEDYCQQNNLQPRIDATNADTAYFRNRLRHDLLPLLETYNPNIRSILWRTASVIAADFEVLEAQTNSAWAEVVTERSHEFVVLDSTEFKVQPLALQRALLRRAIQQLRPPLRDIDFMNIEDAIDLIAQAKTGARTTLPQELMLEVGYDSITISNANETILPDWPLFSARTSVIPITVPGSTQLPESHWVIEASTLPSSVIVSLISEEGSWREEAFTAYLDADSLSGPLSIRPRTSIDRFQPQGMPSTVGLKDWMINVKIPRAVRDRLPLIVSGDQIVWVAGFRVGQPFIVKEDSKRIMKLTFRKD